MSIELDQINYRIRNNLSRRHSLGGLKNLGCSIDDLRKHLESQFEQEMNWDNYGAHGWNIDHIIPLSSTKDYFERIKLQHYKNLRPLWALYNQQKSDSVSFQKNECGRPNSTVNLLDEMRLLVSIGSPFNYKEAKGKGCSSSLLHHYVKLGKLKHLGKGMFQFSNEELQLIDCLRYVSPNDLSFHVGGNAALIWRGVFHDIPFREVISLWGRRKICLPKWFRDNFLTHYTARNVFDKQLPESFSLSPIQLKSGGVLVSSIERALLEMLSEVGIGRSLENAKNIMENIYDVNLDTLSILLNHCSSVKIVRLCLNLSKELNLQWADDIKKSVDKNQTGHGRWTSRLKDGTIIILKPI